MAMFKQNPYRKNPSYVPRTSLSIKYLSRIFTPKEMEWILKRYTEEKWKELRRAPGEVVKISVKYKKPVIK